MDRFEEYLTVASVAKLGIITILLVIIYRRHFVYLRRIDGPYLASVSKLWIVKTLLGGDSLNVHYKLHQKYGPFVRTGPNEVSVCHPDAPKALLLTALTKVCPNWLTPSCRRLHV
jgi:hypothetical protein